MSSIATQSYHRSSAARTCKRCYGAEYVRVYMCIYIYIYVYIHTYTYKYGYSYMYIH